MQFFHHNNKINNYSNQMNNVYKANNNCQLDKIYKKILKNKAMF